MNRQGIILKSISLQRLAVLDKDEGKIIVNLQNNKKLFFPGGIINYDLEKKGNSLFFAQNNASFSSNLSNPCYKKLYWIHEIIFLVNKYIPVNNRCDLSYNILYNSIKLAESPIPSSHIEILRIASCANFIMSLGFLRDNFLQEFVELFNTYCIILLDGVKIPFEIGIEIKKLEDKASYVSGVVTKFKCDA